MNEAHNEDSPLTAERMQQLVDAIRNVAGDDTTGESDIKLSEHVCLKVFVLFLIVCAFTPLNSFRRCSK